MILKKSFLLVLFASCFSAGICQSTSSSFCDDNSYHVLQRFRGETIKINCDTAYLLNKSTFNLLYLSYTSYKAQNDSLGAFFSTADNYLYEYQRQVELQRAQLDTMEQYFRSVSDSSQKMVSSTSSSLRSINANLDTIRLTVDSAKVKIVLAQQ